MKFTRFLPEAPAADRTLLVGDIGGTNANLALAEPSGDTIRLYGELVISSHEIKDFDEAIRQALDLFRREYPGLKIWLCCISGAGPIQNNTCRMTNQGWEIRGSTLEPIVGAPTLIINDFTAVSFALPLLDTQNPKQLVALPRPDGRHPAASGELRAVAGAGTGLGVGFLTRSHGTWQAFPSEGGHMDLASFDAVSEEFKNYLMADLGLVPEYEMVVSGMGLTNLFYFMVETKRLDGRDAALARIFDAPDLEKPALISRLAQDGHEGLTRLMELFVQFYARFASSLSCLLIPRGGFYLAGGIVGKNLSFFTRNHLFMKTFEQHCNPNLAALLREIPVYAILDYSISLVGAANAALSLMVSH